MEAKIAVLPGDGIGTEVIAEAVKALEQITEKFGHAFTFEEGLVGGAAIDAVGDPFPPETVALCEGADAVLFGAVGGPKWSDPSAKVRPEQGLLRMRKHFDLFANLRPVKAWPAVAHLAPLKPELLEGVDILFVRELTSGIYFGERVEGDTQTPARDEMAYAHDEIARVARVAFDAARLRRKRVASVDKANVLACSRLWRRTVEEVAADYADVELEHVLVDSCAMQIIKNPARFDVILTGNMFGDILSDEASVLAGSLGMLPSASLSAGKPGVFEPIHGTAPDIAGKGIANPAAALLTAAMLLRHGLGLKSEAAALEAAVTSAFDDGLRTPDLDPESGLGTEAFGAAVRERI